MENIVESSKDDEVTILHLSDIHYSIPADDTPNVTKLRQINVKKTLNALVKYMETSQQKVHIIAITGDIANEGAICEYREFHKEFLGKLLAATGIDVKNVIMCPGNHDIVFKQLKKEKAWRLDRENFDKLDKNILKSYKQVFGGYIKYQEEFGFTEFEHSKKVRPVIHAKDKKGLDLSFLKRLCGYRRIEGIDFISMNSAWYCRTGDWDSQGKEDKKDFERLTIGAPFLEDAIGILTANEAENSNANEKKYSIMLSHHPFFFDTYIAADPKDARYKEPELTEGEEPDYTKRKPRRYVSCRYQWLDPDEIFENCGHKTTIYGHGKSIIRDIEQYINLILCGHLHEKVNPLLVGKNGTLGLIGGAVCAAPESSLHVEEPFCRFITINKRIKTQEIDEYKYNRDSNTWSVDKCLGVGTTKMIFEPAKIIQKLVNMTNLDKEPNHRKEKLTTAKEQIKGSTEQIKDSANDKG
jgi:predicted MPP superfamily phosphohydrolase